jgi:pimeloyl-ACP methyl ester carboxylesterase
MIDAIGEKIVMGMIYEEVGRYVDEDRHRRAVLDRVLAQLPDSGPIVIIGHSLGALVALEVILTPSPTGSTSPVGDRSLGAGSAQPTGGPCDAQRRVPYDRIDGWINVYNTADPVTRGCRSACGSPRRSMSASPAGSPTTRWRRVADVGVASVIAASLHASPDLCLGDACQPTNWTSPTR